MMTRPVTRLARHRHRLPRRAFTTRSTAPSDVAFAFDIDGVLLRSSRPIGGSPSALRTLLDRRVPFICLTNGGGQSELDRIRHLRARLDVPDLHADAIVQSHTPFRELTHLFDKHVLVVGGPEGTCRHVAQSYGFQSVILPADIFLHDPSIWPFSAPFASHHATYAQPLPVPNPSDLQISAILVFNDPRDFGLDLAITTDLLLSHAGRLGTLSPTNADPALPAAGYQHAPQPELHFSNPDLWWANDHPLSRLGQGAFRHALAGVWRAVTDGRAELRCDVIGKPHARTYAFAERRLRERRADVLGGKAELPPLRKVYMVGDNPASDIAGANGFESAHGAEWVSILVRTGVWRGRGPPEHEPRVIVDDVAAAVEWALRDAERTA